MLIHDDIEDNAIQRRGKRALHKIFGEEQAINTGDYLHTLSWEPICEFLYKNRKIGKLVYNKFTDIIKTTISSQSEDLDFSHFVGSFKNINELKYYKIASGKGAYYSVYGPMQLGAIIANQNIKTINILKDIGEPAGIAAQIQNDILDMIEKSKSGIKFQDIYEGKLTLMLIHTVKLANKYEKLQIKKIYSKKQNKTVYDINFIVRLFKKYNSIEYAKEMRDKYGDFAQKKFKEYEQLLPNNKFRRILKDAINAQYKNYKHT